jgi:ATP-dependent Clp protease ATP-binding subunit ClpA
VLSASPKAAIHGSGTDPVFITPRVKRKFELADEESQRADAEHFSTEHFLLAILSERDTAVAGILSEAGITTERAQRILQNS